MGSILKNADDGILDAFLGLTRQKITILTRVLAVFLWQNKKQYIISLRGGIYV